MEFCMRPILAPSALALCLLAQVGCSELKTTPEKAVHPGLTEEQVIGLLGKPLATARQGDTTFFEYETFDQDRWFGTGGKENVRVLLVRMLNGRVDAVGRKGDFPTPPLAAGHPEAEPSGSLERRTAVVPPAPPVPPVLPVPFDLRTELEKLEKMQKDGLLTEAEYKDLRQRVLEKFKAQ